MLSRQDILALDPEVVREMVVDGNITTRQIEPIRPGLVSMAKIITELPKDITLLDHYDGKFDPSLDLPLRIRLRIGRTRMFCADKQLVISLIKQGVIPYRQIVKQEKFDYLQYCPRITAKDAPSYQHDSRFKGIIDRDAWVHILPTLTYDQYRDLYSQPPSDMYWLHTITDEKLASFFVRYTESDFCVTIQKGWHNLTDDILYHHPPSLEWFDKYIKEPQTIYQRKIYMWRTLINHVPLDLCLKIERMRHKCQVLPLQEESLDVPLW